MKQENNQFDSHDRQLLASNAKQSVWTEIGEAQVIQTIFGRAKVRIIRKHDNVRRFFWMTLVAIMVVSGWQGWRASNTEPLQNVDSSATVTGETEPMQSKKDDISALPALQLDNKREPTSQPQTEIIKQLIIQNRAMHQSNTQGIEQKQVKQVSPQTKPDLEQQKSISVTLKPATPQAFVANKPQTVILGSKNNSANTQQVTPLISNQPSLKQPLVPAIVASRTISPAAQAAASSPAAALPTIPLIKENSSTQIPTIQKPSTEPSGALSR